MFVPRISAILPILFFVVQFASAEVWISAGDMGPSDPDTMIFDRTGLLLTRPESWVHSNTALPYPVTLAGAETIEVTLYFIPDDTVAGDVDFGISWSTHNVGDAFNTPPFASVSDPEPVSVLGSETRIYSQTLMVTNLPAPRALLNFSVQRMIFGPETDTYPTGVYLHAVRLKDASLNSTFTSGLRGTTRLREVSGVPGGPTIERPVSMEFAIAPIEDDNPVFGRAIFITSNAQGQYEIALSPRAYWIGPKEQALNPDTYVPGPVMLSAQTAVVEAETFTEVDLTWIGVAP